jgi:hypothetical protein
MILPQIWKMNWMQFPEVKKGLDSFNARILEAIQLNVHEKDASVQRKDVTQEAIDENVLNVAARYQSVLGEMVDS